MQSSEFPVLRAISSDVFSRDEVKSLGKSFRYAFRGICYCVKNERNMRIHLSAVVLISYFAYFFKLERTEYILLFLCFGVVIASEAFNTAIEALVNLESPAYHHYARIAKDVAAGAVAISALSAAVGGVILFWKPDKLTLALRSLCSDLPALLVFLCLLLLALLFIFNGARLFSGKGPGKSDQMKNYDD